MSFKIGNCKVFISILFFAFIAILFMFDNTAMMGLSLLAATLHELGHLFAMKIVNCPPYSVVLRPGAVVINTTKTQKSYKQDILISLSGPLINLLAACFCALLVAIEFKNGFLTSFMWVNVALALFNLLPTKGLDGGKILESLLLQKLSLKSVNVTMYALTTITIFLTLSTGIYIFLNDFQSPTLLIVGVYLTVLTLLKTKK